MAATAGVRMKVDGIGELKNQMAQAKAAVKALDAELSRAAAEYKATGDAEKYTQEQAKILNQQIEEQTRIVDATKAAMDKMRAAGQESSTAYQNLRGSLANAEAKLITMRQSLQDIGKNGADAISGVKGVAGEVKTLGANAANANASTANLEGHLSNIATNISVDKVIKGIDDITRAAETAAKKVVDISKGMWRGMEDAAEWADTLSTESRNAGIDPETYQRWQVAAEIIDVSIDDILHATDKLSKQSQSKNVVKGQLNILDLLSDEYRETAGLMSSRVDVKLFDDTGKMRDTVEILWEVADAINGIQGAAGSGTGDAIAQQLFGKNFREVKGLFEAGAQSKFNAAMQDAIVLTNDYVADLVGMSDQLAMLNNSYDTAKMAFFAALAPSFKSIAESFTTVIGSVNEWLQSDEGRNALNSFGDSISGIVTSFTKDDLTKALQKAKGFLNDISSSFATFADRKDEIVTGIEAAFAVFTGLKMTGGLLKLFLLVSNLKSLTGGGKIVGEITEKAIIDPATGNVIGGMASTLGGILSTVGTIAGAVAVIQGVLAFINKDNQSDLLSWFEERSKSDNELERFVGDEGAKWYKNLVKGITGNAVETLPSVTAEDIERASSGKPYVYQLPKGATYNQITDSERAFAEAFGKVLNDAAEEWFDAYKASPWSEETEQKYADLEALFNGNEDAWARFDELIDQILQYEQTREDAEGNPIYNEDLELGNIPKQLGYEIWGDLRELGAEIPEEISAGINSGIGDVSSAVAAMTAAIQSAAISGASAGITNNNNTSNTTYIENYNAAVRGDGIGAWNEQNARMIMAYGGS